MADVLLAVFGLIPPLIQFTAVLAQKVQKFFDTKTYIEQTKTLDCIRGDIKSWRVMLRMIESCDAPNGSDIATLFESCKIKIEEYKSLLQQIKRQLRGYLKSGTRWVIVAKVQHLLKDLKNLRDGGELERLLAAANTAISSESNSTIRSMHSQYIKQQKILKSLSGQISDMRAQFGGLIVGLNKSQGTASLQPQLSQLQIEEFDQKLERLEDSLLGHNGSSTETDSSDSEDSLLEEGRDLDTSDTTLHSQVSNESSGSHCGRSRLASMYCDRSTMTNMVGMDPPLRTLSQVTFDDSDLIVSVTKLNDEIAVNQACLEVVSGSFDRTAPTGFEVLKMDQRDWLDDCHFATFNWESDDSITLHIALQEGRLRELVEVYGEDFVAVLETKSTTRRFSAILLPINLFSSLFKASERSPRRFRHILDLEYPQPLLTIHWDMNYCTTRGQVYFRLSNLKELDQNIEAKRQVNSRCALPSFRDIALCITIPWQEYSRWAEGEEKNYSLDALWEQGIVATLPVLAELEDGTEEPHIWCPQETKRSAESSSTRRTVHAIFQEYVHPELPPETGALSNKTRFIVVIYRTGDGGEWVKIVQSILCTEEGRIMEPYRLGANGVPIDIDDLTRHCRQETSIVD